MARSDASELLAPIVQERARILAPALLGSILVFVGLSGSLGIELSRTALWFAGAVSVFLAALAVALLRRRIPGQWNHIASMIVWWCPIAVTLVAQYTNHEISLACLLGCELATAGILLHTGCAVFCLTGATALGVPLVLRDGGDHAAAYLFAIGASCVFAALIHRLMRKAVLDAELRRGELALQLEELHRAQAERTRLHDQLLHSQRMDAVGTLAAGIAHDMNNILGSITSLSSLALDEVSERSQRRTDLEQILAQSARGAELTRGLLAFSRRGQYRKQVVHVADIVRDVLPLLARTLPKSISMADRIDVGDARVDGDPVHLQQALINFGLNAADAMSGQGALHIGATLTSFAPGLPPGHYVRISVTDTGRGMDAETQRRVFEPFFTTKRVGEGTGLGLSTVWGIAQAHGGTVEVASEPGRGATFTLVLPTTEAALAAPAKRPSSQPIELRGTVLVVDDEPVVRRGTQRLLEKMGFDVIAAGDGAEAVKLFSERAVHLVILDMGMPTMGGPECFARLRERSDVPIVIATGYAVDAEAQALVAAGAGILEKPFVPADLAREVTRALAPR